jgi:hypothetical protein
MVLNARAPWEIEPASSLLPEHRETASICGSIA